MSILGIAGSLDFSHGTGCYSDDEDNPKECDWKVDVDEDQNIADDRRLIVVASEHMIGSGAWADLLVLGCRAGKVTALFHDNFNYGVDVEEASADKLSEVWKVGWQRPLTAAPQWRSTGCTCGARKVRNTCSTATIPPRCQSHRSARSHRVAKFRRHLHAGVGKVRGTG